MNKNILIALVCLSVTCALFLGLNIVKANADDATTQLTTPVTTPVTTPTTTSTYAPATVSIADYNNYSLGDLQTLVAELQSIIADKKNGKPCFISSQDISFGDGEDAASNAAVKRLQSFLKEKGYASFTSATGYFGKLTKAGLTAYQKDFGLDQTGEFSGATRDKIQSMKCRSWIFMQQTQASATATAGVSH